MPNTTLIQKEPHSSFLCKVNDVFISQVLKDATGVKIIRENSMSGSRVTNRANCIRIVRVCYISPLPIVCGDRIMLIIKFLHMVHLCPAAWAINVFSLAYIGKIS